MSERGREGKRERRFPAVAVAILLAAAGCGRGEKRSVVIILFDTTRADRLSCYGYPATTSPHVDALASEGLRFLRALTPAPATLPAVSSLLTGRWPRRHGARYNTGYTLSPEAPTLASILGGAGWRTAAFVSAAVLRSSTGLGRGFSTYDDQMSRNAQAGLHFAERPGPETAARALQFVRNHEGESFFLFVHLYEPHFPYEAPAHVSAGARDAYDGEIMAADAAIAPLLKKLRTLKPRPLVVFTGDHGEGLGEHGEDTHGFFLYQSTLHVPLIFWGADLKPGLEPSPVSLVDVAPSILAILGLKGPGGMDGRPVAGGVGGPRVLISEAIAPETEFGWSRAYAATQGGVKIILSPLPKIYRLGEAPEESRALSFDPLDSAHAGLREGLRKIYGGPAAVSGPQAEDDERLRSLGYLGGGGGREERDFVVREDPLEEEKARVIQDTVWLRVQILRGSPEEAARALPKARALLKRFPASPALKELVVEGENRAREPR